MKEESPLKGRTGGGVSEAPLPLQGVRILDLTRLLPGPYATMLLADLGAQVTKVEEPERGDYARDIGPYIRGIGCWYLMFNRNKRSLGINLKEDRGKELFCKLVARSHVVIEGFRPGTARRLGVDFDSLLEHNPRLVYCSLSGYGQNGTYASRVGHDVNYIGVSGLLDMTRGSDGAPVIPGLPIADLAGGLLAAFLITVALRETEATGRGRFLDVSMADLVSSWSIYNLLPYLATGTAPRGGETLSTGKYPSYNAYQAADGKYLTLGATEEKFWRAFCRRAGVPDLESDHTPEDRRRDDVEARIRETLRGREVSEWLEVLPGDEVPVAPVNSPEELMTDPGLADRGIFWTLEDSALGSLTQSRFRVAYTSDLEERSTPPPSLGAHSAEVLRELGLSREEIQELARRGIVALP